MGRTKKFLVLDTETCNSVEQPIPYDIGWAICDKKGNIFVERSFVVSEVFCGMKEQMQSAYYAKKIPQYWDDLKNGTRLMRGMWEIRRQMMEDIRTYKVGVVCAYNMGFDRRALNNLMRYISKSWKRYWFPFGLEYNCIWNMACDVILNRTTYIKFAEKNGLISDANNIQTSAECAYRYIKKDVDFLESHTGLEDVRIEVEIMAECYRQKQKMEKGIYNGCWRRVQKKRKELELRAAFKAA